MPRPRSHRNWGNNTKFLLGQQACGTLLAPHPAHGQEIRKMLTAWHSMRAGQVWGGQTLTLTWLFWQAAWVTRVSMAAQDFFVLGFTCKNFSSANNHRFRVTCASQLFQDARFAPVLDIWNSGIQFSGSLLCEFAAAQGKERHSIHRGGSIHQISEAKVGNTVISCMFLLSANWRSLVLQRWLMSTVILLETKDSRAQIDISVVTCWHPSNQFLKPKLRVAILENVPGIKFQGKGIAQDALYKVGLNAVLSW